VIYTSKTASHEQVILLIITSITCLTHLYNASVNLLTMCQPVSENIGRRSLRSAVSGDLAVPATRTARYVPAALLWSVRQHGTLYQRHCMTTH